MEASLLSVIGIVVMVGALFLIPLGLPGMWIMLAVVAAGAWLGEVSAAVFLGLLALAVGAEVAEYVAMDRFGSRFGGSRRTFWGAAAGGIIGAFVGVPVPVIGPLLGVLAGTLAGGVLATYLESRHLHGSVRAGWGALLGRSIAVAFKVFVGLVILLIGGAALLVR